MTISKNTEGHHGSRRFIKPGYCNLCLNMVSLQILDCNFTVSNIMADFEKFNFSFRLILE